jgi:hypothetical protein
MNSKDGTINWRNLFAGDPTHVTITHDDDGNTWGTDRYSVWDVTACCEAAGIDAPAPGRYRAMSKELRLVNSDPILPGEGLAELFDKRTRGLLRDAPERLICSEWATDRYRPVIHNLTAEVRLKGLEWGSVPRFGGAYWRPCADWEESNVAVYWQMHPGRALGAVQLIGGQSPESWGIDPRMARALASWGEDALHWETVEARYGR